MFGAAIEYVESLDSRSRIAALHDIERRRRALDAEEAALVSVVERTADFSTDGAKSTAAWVRMHLGCSNSEASRRVRVARLTHHHRALGEALHGGRIGVEHVEAFHRVHRNERCRERVPELVELMLAEPTVDLPVPDFVALIREFERFVDTDGALKRSDQAHDDRQAIVCELGGGIFVSAEGHGMVAKEMLGIFERFRHAEWLRDWEQAKAEHGEADAGAHLARTEQQRRFDALAAIFHTAASSPTNAVRPEPIVNIVVDEATFTAHLANVLAGAPVPKRSTVDLIHNARCEFADGTPVDPTETVIAALQGRVRRIVYGAAGVPIDLGRARRLFSRGARDAARLSCGRCLWPGCDTPVQRCEIDHLQPWSRGGPTDQANGGPCCARHNRFKERGFTVRRDTRGRWHILRPDGTELGTMPSQAA